MPSSTCSRSRVLAELQEQVIYIAVPTGVALASLSVALYYLKRRAERRGKPPERVKSSRSGDRDDTAA